MTQNPGMASSMGINPDRINMMTFGLGSGIAGIAGVAIGLYAKVTSEMGSDYIVQSFMTVVVGGVGNVWGTLAGAAMIGFGQKGIEWLNPSNTLSRANLHDPIRDPVHPISAQGHRCPQRPRGGRLIMERASFIVKNPSVLWFLLGLSVFTIVVTIFSESAGILCNLDLVSQRPWARHCACALWPSRWTSFGAIVES